MPSSSPALRGSCACGAITYSCKNLAKELTFCHCMACRQISGGPYIVFCGCPVEEVEWTSNGANYSDFRSTPGVKVVSLHPIAERGSCEKCSSTLCMAYAVKAERVSLTAGTMDLESGAKLKGIPISHIFVADKAPWIEIPEGQEQWEKMPDRTQKILDPWLETRGLQMPK